MKAFSPDDSLEMMCLKAGLNDRQTVFVAEFAIDSNATRAALAAGYSQRAATSTGLRLKNIKKVRLVLAAYKERALTRAKVDADYVINGLKRESEFMSEGCSHGARVSALGKLGDHLGLFDRKVQVGVELSGPNQGPLDIRSTAEGTTSSADAKVQAIAMEIEQQMAQLDLVDEAPSISPVLPGTSSGGDSE
ncbi:MAG: terminase small subunit [bacterium]|nr:terminase small subunit [bacterium]